MGKVPVLIGLVAAIMLISLFTSFCSNAAAQTATAFTPADKFSIPQLNGTISFAVNGFYSSATLENDSWTFNDLALNLPQINNSLPFGNLKISAENSNLTIWSFRSYAFFGRTIQLFYNTQGEGTQIVNLCLNTTQPTHPSEWTVSVPGNNFLAEGNGWTLLPDNSVVISGLTGNVTVTHFGFNILNDSDLPFYQRHSVIITTAILLAVVVAVAVVIRFKVRR